MEFNVFEHFKGYQRTTHHPVTPEEQGSLLLPPAATWASASRPARRRACRPRRACPGATSSALLGFSAAMLAANEVTGMKFFEVNAAEAADIEAKNEAIQVARAGSSDFIVDVHTHVCTRPGALSARRQHHRARHVVRAVARRPRQGVRPAQRHARHERRELRQARFCRRATPRSASSIRSGSARTTAART